MVTHPAAKRRRRSGSAKRRRIVMQKLVLLASGNTTMRNIMAIYGPPTTPRWPVPQPLLPLMVPGTVGLIIDTLPLILKYLLTSQPWQGLHQTLATRLWPLKPNQTTLFIIIHLTRRFMKRVTHIPIPSPNNMVRALAITVTVVGYS